MIMDARDAARLLYLSLQTSVTALNNAEYRELLIRYNSQNEFEGLTKAIAIGMQLVILDANTERGLVVVPMSKESRFAVRVSDLRQMSGEQRIALAIAYLTIAAVFYPTNDRLEEDAYTSRGEKANIFRETLSDLVKRLAGESDDEGASFEGMEPGWAYLEKLPMSLKAAERASLSSIDGCVRLALRQLVEYGMIRVTKASSDEEEILYTPTHRLRIHLREMVERKVFDFISAQISTGVSA